MKKNLSEVEHLFNQKQLNRILRFRKVGLNSLKEWYEMSKGIMVDADLDKECNGHSHEHKKFRHRKYPQTDMT